mgnify:CR=1 FL=1
MAPFKSKAQARYMFSRHPKVAKRWAKKTKSIKSLPEKKNLNEYIMKGRKK